MTRTPRSFSSARTFLASSAGSSVVRASANSIASSAAGVVRSAGGVLRSDSSRTSTSGVASSFGQDRAETVIGAVVDQDRLDGELAAEIDLPPRIVLVLRGVGDAAVGVLAALVAVDGLLGVAAVGGVLLRRLAGPSHVATAAEDL